MAMLETKPSTKEKKFSLIPCSNVYIYFFFIIKVRRLLSVSFKKLNNPYTENERLDQIQSRLFFSIRFFVGRKGYPGRSRNELHISPELQRGFT